jgi:site-specific recombinase XerD
MEEAADATVSFIFPGRINDRPLAHLKGFWKSVTAAAALSDYRIHDNRHTHASHLVSSELSLEIVGRLLGHTSPMTTRRYAHLADAAGRRQPVRRRLQRSTVRAAAVLST